MKKYLFIIGCIAFGLSVNAELPEEIKTHTDAIETFMETYPDLGLVLKDDAALRKEIFSHHIEIRKLIANVLQSKSDRNLVFKWYRKHIKSYPSYFKHSYIDYNEYPYLPQLRFQIWTNLYECKIDETHKIKLVNRISARRAIANTIGFKKSNPLRKILIKHKRLFVENDRTTHQQRNNVLRLLDRTPSKLFKAESIRVRDFLGMQIYKDIKLAKRSGVNVFTNIGLSVLAHELNHTVDIEKITLGGDWTLDARKCYLLSRAAGDEVVFYEDTYKLNKKETMNLFLEKGYWDGNQANWERDWYKYWLSGNGKTHNLNWLRQAGPANKRGIPFFLKSPQEIIAGFANIYFEDSEKLLERAVKKFEKGLKEPINQFLLFAQIYSMGEKITRFYKKDLREYVNMEFVEISRDENGFVNLIETAERSYSFTLDKLGVVQEISVW
ncbi:hypothetical protein COB11_07015 [Candidatus Aerophobetes bacterium]|uniref:Uncharacterized protein n=1 Tax=Aerophobetes bacterium TaxID=2030807 RepID=A0A2A4YD14_UNCAE|nr:MAG: hypothetical protein COB11_07015 [Candidatus Aerophobetes bacterium]